MQFIDRLLKLMEQKQISGYQLEKETGIKQATLGKWKKGSQPTIDKLIILINYFQVSADELLGTKGTSSLTENEKELLNLFRKLPDEEQKEYIIRMKEAARIYQKINQHNNQSNTQSRKDAI